MTTTTVYRFLARIVMLVVVGLFLSVNAQAQVDTVKTDSSQTIKKGRKLEDLMTDPSLKVQDSTARKTLKGRSDTSVVKSQVDTNQTIVAKPPKTEPDTLKTKPRRHSPMLATLLSAAVPGAGQIYNRKYWKAPIVWALLGGAGYYMYYNLSTFKDYRNAYKARIDDDPLTLDEQFTDLGDSEVKARRDQAQKNFELSIVGLSIVYILNLMDAFVDAHLWDFDVSDDLSLRLEPSVLPSFNTLPAFGFRAAFSPKFKSNTARAYFQY